MESDLFKLEYGKEHGDCTCEYIIWLLRECTVREFILEWFKKYPKEWGCFSIYDRTGYFKGLVRNYKNGQVIEDQFPDEVLNAKLLSVEGSGGWTRSDLLFCI